MLKTIILNQKKVPVPIPIKNLSEAVQWVEQHLLRPDHSVTKIAIDGKEVDIEDSLSQMGSLALNQKSKLEMRVDSPTEISIQTIDALRNLSVVLEKSLKPMAVTCWEFEGTEDPLDFPTLCGDLDLILDLVDHIVLLLDKKVSLTNLKLCHQKNPRGIVQSEISH